MIITKFGNSYTEQEWTEMMANWDAEIAQAEDYEDACDAIKREAGRRMTEAGIEGNTFGIAHRIFNNGLEGIEFSSEERRQLVEEIEQWMIAEERKVR